MTNHADTETRKLRPSISAPPRLRGLSMLATVWQCEHVQRLTRRRHSHFGDEGRRDEPRAAAAEAGRHGDVLPAIDGEGDREALHRRGELRLPEDASRPHVDRLERAIEIADERDAAGRRDHGRQERRPLLDRPELLHAVDVVRGELADVAVGPGHLVEAAIGAAGAAAAFFLLDPLRADRQAALAERDDQRVARAMVAHGLPVVAALGARAAVDPLADFGVDDVLPIARFARLGIELLPDVLEDRLLVSEILARLAIQLPQDAVLAGGEDEGLARGIDAHAFEYDVHVERFTRRVRVVPGELAGLHVERERAAGVERLFARVHAAADRHPRLGLRGAPVGQVEDRVVAAGDPRLAAGTMHGAERAPGLAGFALGRDGVELPQLLAGGGVVGADEALLVRVGAAAAHALDDLAARDDRTAGAAAAVGHLHVAGEL